MVYPENGDVLVVRVPKDAAVPSANWTAAEKTALDDVIIALQQPHALGAHSNFDETGAADGKAILRSGTGYVLGDPSGSLATVSQDGVVSDSDVTDINFTQGLTVVPGAAGGGVNVLPTYAGTGAALTVAHSDHTHNPAVTLLATFGSTGVLSSGSRTLYSGNIGPFLSGVFYTITATFLVRARNNINNGTFNLGCRIGGDASFPTRTRNVQTVGGVPVDQIIHFQRTITGSGTTATVVFTAEFSTGHPVDLRDGEIVVTCIPTR